MGDIALKGYLGGVSSGGNLAQVGVTDHALDVNIASGSFSVSVSLPDKVTLTDRSGSIAAGGSAQAVCGANANRKYFFFENVSLGDLWINFTATAIVGQPSIKIAPKGAFVMEASVVSTEAVSVIGATTAQAYVSKEA